MCSSDLCGDAATGDSRSAEQEPQDDAFEDCVADSDVFEREWLPGDKGFGVGGVRSCGRGVPQNHVDPFKQVLE